MPPDLVLSSTLTDSNHPCLELVFMVPKCSSHCSSSVYIVINTEMKIKCGSYSLSLTPARLPHLLSLTEPSDVWRLMIHIGVHTVELQWLEHLRDYDKLFESGVVRVIEGLL